jgi:serine/threonine protein kinase
MIRRSNMTRTSMKQNQNQIQINHSRIDDEEVIYKKYDLGRKLGQGSFGVVYELTCRDTPQLKFALKIINKEKCGKSSQSGSLNFENEVIIMKSVVHENLVTLIEVYETKKVKKKR